MPTRPPADATPSERLALLLLSLYSQDELRRAVRYFDHKYTTDLYDDLPGPDASPRALATGLVDRLDPALLHAFLDQVAVDRPRRSKEIDELRPLFPGPPADPRSN